MTERARLEQAHSSPSKNSKPNTFGESYGKQKPSKRQRMYSGSIRRHSIGNAKSWQLTEPRNQTATARNLPKAPFKTHPYPTNKT